MNYTPPVIVQLCLSFCMAILYLYHLYCLRYTKIKSQYESKKEKILINLTSVSGPLTLLIYLKDIVFYSIGTVTKSSCAISLTLGLSLFTLHKLIIYLYIAIRSQIISKATHFKEYSIWFKIALFLIFSYLLQVLFFIVLLLSKVRTVIVFHDLCLSDALFDVAIWQMSADIIIGIYCFSVLIFPLRKILTAHEQQVGQLPNDIKLIVRNIVKYSFIAIITAIFTYPLIFIFIQHSSILVSVELFITNYCIIMQLPHTYQSKKTTCLNKLLNIYKLRMRIDNENGVKTTHTYNNVQTHTSSGSNRNVGEIALETVDNTSTNMSRKPTATTMITSTNITNRIRNTNFPQFRLSGKYLEESEKIFVVLIKSKIAISIENISQIISEYATTVYRECSECKISFGFIECFEDYFICNNALANCDPFTENIRYYLDCEPSFSTVIQGNKQYYDENVGIVCKECCKKWQCSICYTQFLSHSYQALLCEDGCDICKCIMCDDCAVLCDNKLICVHCYDKIDGTHGSIIYVETTTENMVSNWGSFGF